MSALSAALRRARRSLAVRLSLTLAAVFLAVLSGIGVHLYKTLGDTLAARTRVELDGKTEMVRRALGALRSPRDIASHRQQFDDILFGQHQLSLAIFDGEGETLYASATFGAPDPGLLAWIRNQTRAELAGDSLYEGGVEHLVKTSETWVGPGEAPVWIGVAVEARTHGELLAAHGHAMLVALALGAGLAALGGIWTIHAGLAPVRRIADAEARISANRLDLRVPVEDAPLELVRFVEGFNSMLDRLNDSFRRISEFSSDLAHELRTPINNLIGHAQVALSRPRTAEEYRETIETIAEDGERMARMVRDMLFLARADNAAMTLEKESFDLRAEIDQLVSYFDLLADERGIAFACRGQGKVQADREMVRRAIGNLLSNALSRTPRGGTVDVDVRSESRGGIRLEVSNPGPGIAAGRLPRIFDRFYRADPARSDPVDGAGLGLAIVKSIMELHGGTVEAVSRPDGPTTFRLNFPA